MSTAEERVLHHLVVKGRADAQTLIEATGDDAGTVTAALTQLTSQGAVVEKSGRLPGFAPTADGRQRAGQRVRASALYRRRAGLDRWYDDGFGPLNTEFKALCAAWQLIDGPAGPVLNDHTDAGYDQAILGRLSDFHDRATARLADAGHPRIDRYAARLAAAMTAVRAGHTHRFTAPLQDSYHDIWMELHQDLLFSLARVRTAADA
jgi:hypothetical protein